MASGSTVQDRTRESESRGKFAPGLTPVSLFLVLVLFWVLTKTGLVLVLGLLALLLGTVLEGPVRRLEDRHFPRAAAIATVYAVLIGSVVALVLLIMPAVRSQADDFQEQIPVQLRETGAGLGKQQQSPPQWTRA
jgi:predicted PurR-regulated permease PerM